MDGIEWSTLAANIGTFSMAAIALFGGFWAIVSKQTKNLIRDNAVSNEVYERQQKLVNDKLERLERSDAEFRVMQSQIQNVQNSVEGLADKVDETAQQQRQELNGGLVRLENTMREYIKAATGKS